MTTKVLVVNHGPERIKVLIKDGGDDSFTRIDPTQSREFYVHQHQSLEVIEIEPIRTMELRQDDLESRN